VLIAILERSVDRRKVLRTTHAGDPQVSGFCDWLVFKTKASWVPSLSNFGVYCAGHVEIGINLGQDSNVELFVVAVTLKSVVEDHLKVGVPSFVILKVGRGFISTIKSDVCVGKSCRLVRCVSCEIEGNRSEAGLVHPY